MTKNKRKKYNVQEKLPIARAKQQNKKRTKEKTKKRTKEKKTTKEKKKKTTKEKKEQKEQWAHLSIIKAQQ